jgi:predicted nucleotidyltransferase
VVSTYVGQASTILRLNHLTQMNAGFTLKSIMGIEQISKQREQILSLAARYGASHIRVFGSFARGTADERSDIDFLVDLAPGRSLFDLGGLLYELQQLLGRSVDVVTTAGLRPRIRDRVLSEAVAL